MDCFRRCQVNNLCHSQIIQCVIIYSGNTGMYSGTQLCDYVRALENPDISKFVHLLHQVISMLLFLKSCFILLCNLLSGVEQEKAYQKGTILLLFNNFYIKKKKKEDKGQYVCMVTSYGKKI